jgi:hypothetical protein
VNLKIAVMLEYLSEKKTSGLSAIRWFESRTAKSQIFTSQHIYKTIWGI